MSNGRAFALYDQFTMTKAVSILGELRNPQLEVLIAWPRRILARTLEACHCTRMLAKDTESP